tara:strand:- start:138 stop:956 length:819 start_codon:yes stop_codon:yes gene_type:complete
MTAKSIEFVNSRAISSSGGRGSGTRTFHLTGVTSASTAYNYFGTSVGSGDLLPKKGDQHPDFPGLVAKDFDMSLVDGHTDVWKITWTYEVISQDWAAAPESIPEVLPNEVDYVEISSQIRAEFVSVWRVGVTYPEYGDPDNDTVECEGVSIDKAGVPLSVQRNIQELTITETVNVPDWETYRAVRFTRNNRPFLGADTGKVLYRGTSVARTGVNVYQVSHSFVEDQDYHLQQSPKLINGEPALTSTGLHAESVYWVQPFSVFANHNAISKNF